MSKEINAPLIAPIPPAKRGINNRVALYLDSRSLLISFQETLLQAGFITIELESLNELLKVDNEIFPAAIIADLGRCRREANADEVFTQLRLRFNPPRHLFCIGDSDDIPARLEAVRLGATRFLSNPSDIGRMIKVLNGVTAQTPTQPFKALLIEEDRADGNTLAMALNEAGVETLVIRDPLQAPDLIGRLKPDVVVSDVSLPGCNGIELLAMLRQDDALADTPIIILSSENSPRWQMDTLSFGGDDFLLKPVDGHLFVATVIARAKRARTLKRSRSEYRSILEQLREMKSLLPRNFSKAHEKTPASGESFSGAIPLDDYAVQELH